MPGWVSSSEPECPTKDPKLSIRESMSSTRESIMYQKIIVLAFLCSVWSVTQSPQELCCAEVKTTFNKEPGLWSGDKRFKIVPGLVIGKEDRPEEYVLGRISGIAVNSDGDIYVLDNGYVRVQRYDSLGQYMQTIGSRGEGPGEFFFPTALALDNGGNLYVVDQSAISIFGPDGKYVDKFRHGQQSLVRSICVDPKSGIYISCFDALEQQMIHKYDFAYNRLFSFCDSYAVGKDVDVRVEDVCAGGMIDIGENGIIVYTQQTPFEIRRFSPSGTLLSVCRRENRVIKPPVVEITGSQVTVNAFAASSSIIVMNDGKLINEMKSLPQPDDSVTTVIDLFDSDGRLLLSRYFQENFSLKCRDSRGRLYGVDMEEYPRVIRYNLEYAEVR
jgi:hypothetical protein